MRNFDLGCDWNWLRNHGCFAQSSDSSSTSTTSGVRIASTLPPVELTVTTLPRTPDIEAWCVGYAAPIFTEMGFAFAESNAYLVLQRAAEVLAAAPEEIYEEALRMSMSMSMSMSKGPRQST